MSNNQDTELSTILKLSINALAATYYRMHGKNAGAGFDFSKSSHPEEYRMWNMAVIAYAHVNNDSGLLAYQVDSKTNPLIF